MPTTVLMGRTALNHPQRASLIVAWRRQVTNSDQLGAMPTGFINKLPGGIEVIHKPAERQFGDVSLDSPPKGCGHTTEGTSLPSYRAGQTDAPTFTVGYDKVWQHRGLGKMCGTLFNAAGGVETNRLIRIQFELVGFSTRESWLPARSFQRDALAAIKELAHDELGVRRRHVWPDKQDDDILATSSYHRRQSKFPDVSGWYGHVEIPENEHWDWGSLRWDDLDAAPAMVDALAFVERFKNDSGHWQTREISPFFSNKAALRNWAVVPDSPTNIDLEDELRRSLFNALCENRVWVAKRKVSQDKVAG
jgi:hypothetical protein